LQHQERRLAAKVERERPVIAALPALDLQIVDTVRQRGRVSVAEESRVSKIRTEASCRGYIMRRKLWNASACGEPASTLTGSIFASNANPEQQMRGFFPFGFARGQNDNSE
jgi:hypothetical protein